ncbi:uncharacterized protein SAPINGB_P000255 [Magnusiomyces paraingens]|uniref:Rho-GAP domain-containing protein n=1 Tax=Magnusiomyces paraingens TaxID=2606893 RepID=A0A5E8AYF9_9ASCO|nr:uncharacterized protein SAPINGB_P000255 [Saprochaete ingens]VVT44006.1 unnamed protein product [Saprochaete ingens]
MIDGLGGRLFRTFKRRSILESNIQNEFQLYDPTDVSLNMDSYSTTPVNGKFNIFGIPLVDATRINKLDSIVDQVEPWNISTFTFDFESHLPLTIVRCIEYINNYGLHEEGLYRMSGSTPNVQKLRNAFVTQGPSYCIPKNTDIHDVTTLVKSFFRELPEDLLPVTNRHTFLAYSPSEIPTEFTFSKGTLSNYSLFTPEEEDLNPIVIPTQILQEILQDLPPHNFAMVHLITNHLRLIVENSKFNKMSLSNLSMILCRTLRIHKSVFHALIIKGPSIWVDLHPNSSPLSTRLLKYNTSRILEYSDGQSLNDLDSAPLSKQDNNTSVSLASLNLDYNPDYYTSSSKQSTMFERNKSFNGNVYIYNSKSYAHSHTSINIKHERKSSIFEDDNFDRSSCSSFESMNTLSQHQSSYSTNTTPSVSSYYFSDFSKSFEFKRFQRRPDSSDFSVPGEFKLSHKNSINSQGRQKNREFLSTYSDKDLAPSVISYQGY